VTEKNLDNLIEALDILWKNFNNCRAHFPCVPEDSVGVKSALTSPFYLRQGFNISFVFSAGISSEQIAKINQIGHWINQNFIIRLCALLESYNIFSETVKIDKSIKGSWHIDIVRRLRHYFAHSSGRYHSNDKRHLETMKSICEKFGYSIALQEDWPLPIDTVLKQLYEGCVDYAKMKMKSA